MKKRNPPYTDLRKARFIGANLDHDIRYIKNYKEDSIVFYGAMRERALYYLDEIRRYFGYTLYPEDARAPMTLEEWRRRDWKFHAQRASALLDLAFKATQLHILAAAGMNRLLKNKTR